LKNVNINLINLSRRFLFYNLIESIIKDTRINTIEQRSRSNYPKQHEQERARSLSSQAIFDPINSRLSKSNENMTQSISQKYSSTIESQRGERITKSEDRLLSNTQLNDLQIQRFHFLKDKFERQQPINTIFGIKNRFIVL